MLHFYIKWKHFPRYWPFVRGIHRSPVNSPHKGQWRGALMFSLICVWIDGWINHREAGDLRRYRAHYDVTVMVFLANLILTARLWQCGLLNDSLAYWTVFTYQRNNLVANLWDPFYKHRLALTAAWISNHMLSKVWNGITYPFLIFNGYIVDVWEWIINFIPHLIVDIIDFACWD